MIIKKTINLPSGLEIFFGMPNTKQELDEMFSLRHKVYVDEKKYIPSGLNILPLDIDEHDENKECIYFIATVKDKIVGTTRIIRSEILPTERDYFYFDRPKAFVNFSPSQLSEIGRIISRPHFVIDEEIPRGLVMLGLMSVMVEYAESNGILGGLGSIKNKAFKKLSNMGIPMHLVKRYKPKFNPEKSNDPLKNFFNKNDPVIPLYFLVSEVSKYFRKIFEDQRFFQKVGDGTYIYKDFKMNILQKVIFRLKTFV